MPTDTPAVSLVTAADPAARSADIVADNVQALRGLFPDAFVEGKVDFDVLRGLLGDTVDDGDEKYGLNWSGKRQARRLALTPSLGTLRPATQDSLDWDSTRNLMIEGDNLEVLKLMQKSYAGKVKLIYIDPPYNTGSDFVYPDDYSDNLDNYLRRTGQVDAEGRKNTTNTESGGRFHSDWLGMMLPRLMLAHSLLSPQGVMLVFIDDAELANLTLAMDGIFGQENRIATLIIDRNRKNDAKYFSVGHEYVLVYFKNEAKFFEHHGVLRGAKEGVDLVREEFARLTDLHGEDWSAVRAGILEFYAGLPEGDAKAAVSRFRKVDARGPYRDDGNINWPGGGGPRYEVLHPDTGAAVKLPVSGWRYPKPERFWEEFDAGRVVFGPDETTVPRVRTNLFENDGQVMSSVWFSYAQTSTNILTTMFEGHRVFDNPKSIADGQKLISYLTKGDEIVLDFFAGSGTTGHAVMAQNAADGGDRRYILVQLPELLDPTNRDQKTAADFCDALGKPRTIAELTKERLRRASAKVKADHRDARFDGGFRVYKLATSNLKAWQPGEDLQADLLSAADNLAPGRSEDDLLVELLLKQGIDLCEPVVTKTIAGRGVHAFGGGVLAVCLADVATASAEALADGIAEWLLALTPAAPTTIFFKDSGFENDTAKTNIAAILEQRLGDQLLKVRSV